MGSFLVYLLTRSTNLDLGTNCGSMVQNVKSSLKQTALWVDLALNLLLGWYCTTYLVC